MQPDFIFEVTLCVKALSAIWPIDSLQLRADMVLTLSAFEKADVASSLQLCECAFSVLSVPSFCFVKISRRASVL